MFNNPTLLSIVNVFGLFTMLIALRSSKSYSYRNHSSGNVSRHNTRKRKYVRIRKTKNVCSGSREALPESSCGNESQGRQSSRSKHASRRTEGCSKVCLRRSMGQEVNDETIRAVPVILSSWKNKQIPTKKGSHHLCDGNIEGPDGKRCFRSTVLWEVVKGSGGPKPNDSKAQSLPSEG